jgi:hypothetical protein
MWMTNIQGSPRNFVVREGQSDQCKVVAGDFGDKPEGAMAALHMQARTMRKPPSKRFSQCKGGETTEK